MIVALAAVFLGNNLKSQTIHIQEWAKEKSTDFAVKVNISHIHFVQIGGSSQ